MVEDTFRVYTKEYNEVQTFVLEVILYRISLQIIETAKHIEEVNLVGVSSLLGE